MKIYLDANILYGFFKGFILSKSKKERFTTPRKIKVLEKASSKHTLFTSILTKAEIMRRMRVEFKIEYKKLEHIWNSLSKLLNLKVIKKIEVEEDLSELCGKNKLRCRINNVIHLYICIKHDLILLTGDEKLLEDGKKVYGKIIDYPTLVRKI